ncbi:MAG TPA: SRPBCC domain-containing protein [Gaiellaceae bacterium]
MADGITIVRVFDAPRERVWTEWTEPEAFADWFGGAEAEIPLSTVSMDVRPGGTWHATMYADPGRREIHWKGEYLEVVVPERLVFTVTDRPDDDARELITVVFSDLGDGRTEMHFRQTGHMSAEQYERTGQGWSKFFDRIDARLVSS